jgi:uncharacterized protein (TIGR03083 family)
VDLDVATDTIATAGAALTAAARTAPDAPVTACPGWDVTELVRHVGRVNGWAASIVREGATERMPFPTAPDGKTAIDWADHQRTELLEALATADPDRPVWVFGALAPARFWWRRQAHETAVHAWDGTAAVGPAWVIPGGVAADGIEEFLGWFVPRKLSGSVPEWGDGRSVHLHRTDGEGEWLLTIANPPTLEHGHAKGDLAVRGTSCDLLLWTLNRPAEVELFGDVALAEAWRENVTF